MMPSLYEIVSDVSTHLNFSVIPLTGKRPPKGFAFSRYQTERPQSRDLHAWFADAGVASYGVVCGSVSGGLFVLDFDSVPAYQTFTGLFPALAASYTIKTRRGYHIYLRSRQPLHSHKIPGGDLLAQGSLVVGVGSRINDFCYSIAVQAPILDLSREDLNHLLLWASYKTTNQTGATTAAIGNPQHLVSLYSASSPLLGRNNALYRAALSAAQTGINQAETVGSLALLYATAPAVWAHPPESKRQRMQEALATIASAYKASHTQRHAIREQTTGLPNALRESLLKIHQSSITARLLDIFALAGWRANRIFSTREAVEIAGQYGLGRSSVLAVLSGALSRINNQTVIPHIDPNRNTPPVGEVDNGRFNSRGRRSNYYSVPDLADLCHMCGIAPEHMGSSDPLTADDVMSEKAYRMAMHRELVRRAAPELAYRWHATRLNVSAKTVRRYNAALGVIVTPIFGYVPVSWANVERDELWGEACRSTEGRIITPGQWIQSAEGKRYPALKGIACRLLKARSQLIACKRLPSRFQLPVADRPIIIYACIWRRMDAAAPDWGGGEHAYPVTQSMIADTPTETHAPDPLEVEVEAAPDESLLHFVNAHLSLPQDLTVLKGVGTWYETILNTAGITRYRQLADADPDRIARLSGMGQYVTARQVSFWIDQARVLATGALSAADLHGWAYKDWCHYDFERGRIDSASHTLRRGLAQEFREKGWLKYHGSLPEWFVELVIGPSSRH